MARTTLLNVCELIKQANNKLSPAESFLNDLKHSMELTDEANQKLPSLTYKPSSMKCIRSMYYMRRGVEPEKSNATYCSIGICNSGSDIHIRIQQAIEGMKANGIDCEYVDVADFIKNRDLPIIVREKCGMETKLFDPVLNLSFMMDGIVRYNNRYMVLEIKSEASFKWRTRDAVAPEHQYQATAYSYESGLPDVLFIYVNRDILDMKAFIYTPTAEEKKNFTDRITYCEEMVEKQTPPPKPAEAGTKMCEYCGYRTVCHNDK